MFPKMFGIEIELNTERDYRGEHLRMFKPHQAQIRWLETYSGSRRTLSLKMEPGWKAVYDATCGSELVSPPLSDFKPVVRQLQHIKSSGLKYSLHNCGLHVHVSAIDLREDDVINVAKFCRYFDRTIFSFMAQERIRKWDMCSMLSVDNERISHDVKRGRSMSRYRGCNVDAWFKHGTIEFRYAEGTDDVIRMISFTELYTKLVQWVQDNPDRIGKLRCKPNLHKKRQFILDLLDISLSSRSNLLERFSK